MFQSLFLGVFLLFLTSTSMLHVRQCAFCLHISLLCFLHVPSALGCIWSLSIWEPSLEHSLRISISFAVPGNSRMSLSLSTSNDPLYCYPLSDRLVISLFVWSRLTFILKMCPVALHQKALLNLAPVLLIHNFLSFFHLNAFVVVVIAADLATSFQVQELFFFLRTRIFYIIFCSLGSLHLLRGLASAIFLFIYL